MHFNVINNKYNYIINIMRRILSSIYNVISNETSLITINNTTFYLCIEDKYESHPHIIHGFIMKPFSNKLLAIDYWKKNYNINNFSGRHVTIPICSFIPSLFHKPILNYKLRNIYWLNCNKIIK